MLWRTDPLDFTGDWAGADWTEDDGTNWIEPKADMGMIVNSGIATVTAAPTIPLSPPITRTLPRLPLCISGANGGSIDPAQPSSTKTGHSGRGGGNPMSVTTMRPHQDRLSR